MLSAVKVYFKLAWFCKTPFIHLLDTKYEPITLRIMNELYAQMPKIYYIPELRDCDDFGWIYKAIASEWAINAVGLVIGNTPGGLHCWNLALCEESIYQIEPQTGQIFQKKKGYKILEVII